jgi:amino acid permease
MSFAFVSHHIAFTVYNSLKEPSLIAWEFIIRAANGVALTLCLIMGLGGDAIFGRHVQGNILNNFTSSGVVVSVAKALLALCMMLTNPLECFMARHCAISMYSYYATSQKTAKKLLTGSNNPNPSDSEEGGLHSKRVASYRNLPAGSSHAPLESSDAQDPGKEADDHQTVEVECANNEVFRIFVTLFLWAFSTVLALIFTDLAVVLSFVGCVTASMIGYIIPSALFFVSYKEESLQLLEHIKSRNFDFSGLSFRPYIFVIPTILFFFGFAVMFIGVTSVTGGH